MKKAVLVTVAIVSMSSFGFADGDVEAVEAVPFVENEVSSFYVGIGLELDPDLGVPATDQHSSPIEHYLGYVSRLDRKNCVFSDPIRRFCARLPREADHSLAELILCEVWGESKVFHR